MSSSSLMEDLRIAIASAVRTPRYCARVGIEAPRFWNASARGRSSPLVQGLRKFCIKTALPAPLYQESGEPTASDEAHVTSQRATTGMAYLFRTVCAQDAEGQSDGQLLGQFLARHDKAAFAALVGRHGPMVLAVCQRILGNASDAEDAFQATFLVLVRKAASLSSRRVLGDWLHGVARHTALNARRAAARRHAKEQFMARPEAQSQDVRPDWLPILDEALSRLPTKYRLAIVLCDLECRSRREVAQRLGWPEGTVAGRLSRGRALLAKELARRGLAVSSGLLAAALGHCAAAAAVPSALAASTIQAASLLVMGTGAVQGALPAKAAALADTVVKTMFLSKIKVAVFAAGTACLALVAGAFLVLGSGLLPASGASAGAVPVNHQVDAANTDAQAEELVRQLGSAVFTNREAASKALANMGARAAAAVRAGINNVDLETVRRCELIWPKLWKAELERPEADRLAGFAHPLWVRFRKVAGDDSSSRHLFAALAADLRWFEKLEAIDADPAKAADAYARELKQRVEAVNQGYRDAEAQAQGRSGIIVPTSGTPTAAEFATLLFLGTFPSTAAVTFRETGSQDRVSHFNMFEMGLSANDGDKRKAPAICRLFAAWLETRTEPDPTHIGLHLTVRHSIAEVLPMARKIAESTKREPTLQGMAVLVIGRLGGAEDLALLKRAFADARVFRTTKHTENGNERQIDVQVGDAAVGSALWIYGQRAADFGFPLAEMYKNHPDTLADYYLLGFFDNDTRLAAHKKAADWLDKHKDEKPTRMVIKDWQPLFDGKTTNYWKTEGQVSIEDGTLKIGGDKGGSIATSTAFGRGLARFSYRQAGEARATMIWRGEEHALGSARQGWTSEEYEPAAEGESQIRLVAPPGTTLIIQGIAYRPY
jgi:RNA polymerase sigma factor (sigma-70 family)